MGQKLPSKRRTEGVKDIPSHKKLGTCNCMIKRGRKGNARWGKHRS